MIGLLASWWLACGGPEVDCTSPTDVIAEAGDTRLTCHQTDWLVEYWEVLRASALPKADRRLVRRALARRFANDATGTTTMLARVRAEGERLTSLVGPEAVRARGTAVHAALNGRGPATGDDLSRLQATLLPVWGSSAAAQVSLSESDVEGWIRYASLCREVQGGTPLRISVADRVRAYRAVKERFATGSVEVQVAMTALGAAWPRVEREWKMSGYGDQQAWILDAPLPGPLNTDSVGYLAAIVGGDVPGHVRSLEAHFGPFTLGSDEPMFRQEDATPR